MFDRQRLMMSCAAAFVVSSSLSVSLAAPLWIWTSPQPKNNEQAEFKIEFEAPAGAQKAKLLVAADNGARVKINGQQVATNEEWATATEADVTKAVKQGRNEFRIVATNEGSMAGLIASLEITDSSGAKKTIETGADWQASPYKANQWSTVHVFGPIGTKPWGNPFASPKQASANGNATDPNQIQTLPGFKVEQLYVVPKSEEGSWVSMTVDPQGRLICGDQYGSLYRVTAGATASETKVQRLKTNVGGAHGLLYAFDSLYLMNNEKASPACKPGLWRLKDKDGDGEFESEEHLLAIDGGGEHGPHAIVLSPDGQSLFLACGNHTKLIQPLEKSRAARAWQEDHLLPRMWDANGHAAGILAPGGYIIKVDPEAKTKELFCYGFRNEYDIAFNDEGELFTYDSDMEWDIGAPWYRPTRVIHCVSGADYGWRSGSGKWPAYYPDSLPALVDIGPGSPTGVLFGTGAKFPEKYQRALYAADWTYGTMYAIHIENSGGTYKAVKEEFISGKPLPLTDLVINPKDGAMYFAIGGRKTQSALYRVTHERPEPIFKRNRLASDSEGDVRAIRVKLESLHEKGNDESVVTTAWPYLGHEDRFVRYAARVAIERQPVHTWMEKLWDEPNRVAALEGIIALARVGHEDFQIKLLEKLGSLEFSKFTQEQQLAVLRACQLIFIRTGKPSAGIAEEVIARLDAIYPYKNNEIDRELAQLLIFLGSPTAVAKTVQLMATAGDFAPADPAEAQVLARNSGYAQAFNEAKNSRPNRQQFALAWWLRAATVGWTPELRKQYFAWFPTTKKWKGGNSFAGFIENARKEALKNVTDDAERAALDSLSSKVEAAPVLAFTPPKGPGQNYTIDDVLKLAADGSLTKGRDFASGKNLFGATACQACHRFAGDGGGLGPDLSGAGSRYSLRDLMENIIDPSKVISDQYESTQIQKKDGTPVVGRVIKEEGGKVFIAMNPLDPTHLIEIPADEIASRKPYPVSMMPPGLINSLNHEELKDLIAYILSAGNPEDAAFKK